MSTLITIGNLNPFTFANAILAANEQSKKLFEGEVLDNIHIFHSEQSFNILCNINVSNNKKDWIKFLKNHDITAEKFIHRTININSNNDKQQSLEKFVKTVEEVINKNENIIIDLSNGTTFQKNLLSVTSYILNIEHQYLVDIIKLSELTEKREFLPPNILLESYTKAPESKILDSLAYLDLSEIKRYKDEIEKLSNNFREISLDKADIIFFKDNLKHSIELKLKGDKQKNNALYRIASASIASSAEELITLILQQIGYQNYNKDTLGKKLNILFEFLEKSNNVNMDLIFIKKLNDFLLFLRNSTTHKDTKIYLSAIERFKAELSVNMTLAFIEFYTEIVYPNLLNKQKNQKTIQNNITYIEDLKINETYFFGIDGDNTGAFLENMLIKKDTNTLKKTSKSITTALNKIENYIKKVSKNNEIIFKTGDDMLIKGILNLKDLQEIQNIYTKTTDLTCSIGFGKSSKDAFIALKLAKATPNKNSIKGIILK